MLNKTLLNAFILFMTITAFHVSVANAEVKSFQANGSYVMNDTETIDNAQQTALKEAERAAVEQAGVYIESYTKVENNKVVSDEILSLASNIIKITNKEFENRIDDKGNIQVIARIIAEIDTDRIDEKIKNGEYSNILHKQDKLNESVEQQNKEISELKKKLKEVNDNIEKNKNQKATDNSMNNEKPKLEENVTMSSNIPVNMADVYDGKGFQLFKMGLYDDAILQFNLAISNNRDFAIAYLHRGDAYSAIATRNKNIAQMDLAISDYSIAIKLLPDVPFGYLGRAFCYLSREGENENHKDNYNKAFLDLNNALKIDPNNATAHEYMGMYYFLIGNDRMAIKSLDTAVRLNPGDRFAYYYRALAYKDLGDNDNFNKDIRKAKELGVIVNVDQL